MPAGLSAGARGRWRCAGPPRGCWPPRASSAGSRATRSCRSSPWRWNAPPPRSPGRSTCRPLSVPDRRIRHEAPPKSNGERDILRTSELQRLCKVLEDSGVKIDSVASSITTMSARAMVEALVAGERDPRVLAELALGRMRKKIPDLAMALSGRFTEQHALLARMHLEHVDHLTGMIQRLDTQIEQLVAPRSEEVRALRTIPGIGERTAQVLISEIGVEMSRFPTADHLASWVGLAPGNNESAGKHRRGKTRKGNRDVREALVEAARAAGRTATYLGARFGRLHRRFGKKGGGKAAVAIAHDLIVIAWHVLHDESDYRDLGADYFTRHDNPDATKRRLIRELQALGYTVDLTPAA